VRLNHGFSADCRSFIGGSDAQIIMGADEAALISLWREKRGEVESQDPSVSLIVQLRRFTEPLNRHWYECNTGHSITNIQRRVGHPVNRWMRATLDGVVEPTGAVFAPDFMLSWSSWQLGTAQDHMAQIQHDMWVVNARTAVISIVTALGEWVELVIAADPLYQHLLLTAERKFLRCVETGEPPRVFGIERPAPSIVATRMVDMRATGFSNELAAILCTCREALRDRQQVAARTRNQVLGPAPTCVGETDLFDPDDREDSLEPTGIDKSILAIGEPRRYRDKAHLAFVATKPCLVCGRRPADAHHVRFAQKPALGRKVSDEFAVPLCRFHHGELHRTGNEYLWWENIGIDPLKAAGKLWNRTLIKRGRLLPQRRSPRSLLVPTVRQASPMTKSALPVADNQKSHPAHRAPD
jgi:hypothetical protein